MINRRSGHRIAPRLAFLLLAVVAASSALAYWTATGSGSGVGAAGTSQAVTLSAGTPTSPVYPGGHGDVALTIDNPNPFRVHVGSLSLATSQGTGGFQVDAGHSGCNTSTLSFATQTNGGAGWSVAPRVGSTHGVLSVDLADAVTMGTTAASACQGATFDVYLSAGP
jgi:hypothetical protein